MDSRPIMDAGPGLNFFSLNKERLLFSVLGALCVPETVENEILRKARQDPRFSAAQAVWNKLPSRLMEILSDDATDEMAAAVSRFADTPFQERVKSGQDLGETMVIAHAVVAAEAGADVTILIDEREGTQIAAREQQRLRRLQAAGNPVGSIRLVNTITVLNIAVRKNRIPGKTELRDLYDKLRKLDDGLPPIDYTGLLSPELWAARNEN